MLVGRFSLNNHLFSRFYIVLLLDFDVHLLELLENLVRRAVLDVVVFETGWRVCPLKNSKPGRILIGLICLKV